MLKIPSVCITTTVDKQHNVARTQNKVDGVKAKTMLDTFQASHFDFFGEKQKHLHKLTATLMLFQCNISDINDLKEVEGLEKN